MDDDHADEALTRMLRSYLDRCTPEIDASRVAQRAMAAQNPRLLPRPSWHGARLAGTTAVAVVAAVGVGILFATVRPVPDGAGSSTGPTAQPTQLMSPIASSPPTSPATVAPSRPASTWSEIVIDPGATETVVLDVLVARERWVVVGYSEARPAIWSSGDGRTWTRASAVPEVASGALNDVALVGDVLVTVGWQTPEPGNPRDDGLAWFSIDGLTWSSGDGRDSFAGSRILSVAEGSGRVVALGSGADGAIRAWASGDRGQTWDPVNGLDAPAGSSVGAVIWAGERFVAVGEYLGPEPSPGVWISPDGIAWTRVSEGLGDGSIADVAIGEEGLVAVGSTDSGGAAIWRSPDGITWSSDSTAPESQGLVGVGAGSGQTIVIAGQPGPASIWRSDGGTAWERDAAAASRGAAMRSVTFYDGAWVVAGDRSGVPIAWIGR